jgi:PAS domain-containing protein
MQSDSRYKQDNPYQQNICAELVYLLYSQAFSAITGTMIIATFLAFSLYKVIPDYKVFGWYSLMLVMAVSRYVVVKLYMRRLPPPSEQLFWRRVFCAMALFAGVCWSFAGFYLMPPYASYQVLIACALSGVTAGAIPFFSGSRMACALFVIPILSTFALWSFFQGGEAHMILTLIVISYLILLLISASKTNDVIYNAVRLKFVNDELVSHLTAAQKQMVITNQSLNKAAEERSRAEERLRESEEQYRLVTDALPVMIA